MYRNLFVVHFRYGTNVAVRLAVRHHCGVVASPLRGGRRRERAPGLREALGMRRLDPATRLD